LTPDGDDPSDDAIKHPHDISTRRDLRNSTRHSLHCPVTLTFGNEKYRGVTIDISAGGVLLRTECPAVTDAFIHYTVELPGDAFGMKTPVKVKCQGRIVRCSASPSPGEQIIAIAIDDYYFEPSRKRKLLKTG